MKTVKEIYDYFHQFPNADKKSASLIEFLETIPGFSIIVFTTSYYSIFCE